MTLRHIGHDDLRRSQRVLGHTRLSLRAVALVGALVFAHTVAASDDVHIWIRAFIPDAVPAATAPAVNTASGAVLVASDGGCVATDQRSWSDAASARSRLVSDFHLLVDANAGAQLQPSGKQVTTAAGIRSVDCGSGAEIAVLPAQLLADEVRAPGQIDPGQIDAGQIDPGQSDKRTQVSVLAAVADPLRSWSSATIHYDATFTYDQQNRTLEYQAQTGFFPAYEAYATLNDGPVVTVFHSGPVRRAESAGSSKPDASVQLKGAVNLGDTGKRPKAPTNFTVQ